MTKKTFLDQEYLSTKLFLILFYIFTFSFEFITYILRDVLRSFTSPTSNYEILIFFLLGALLPVSVYLIKKKQIAVIKYLYFISYTVLNIINELLIYFNKEAEYNIGGFTEFFLILIAPIFVNKRFFWVVSLGTIGKYIFVGILIQSLNVLAPIVLLSLLVMVTYLILTRFFNYLTAIGNAFDEQLEQTVKAVVSVLELKDPYTKGHSERVAMYSNILAKELDLLNERELQSYFYATLLHDVGKVNVPDSILTKPSKLDVDEYEIIKTHTTSGAKACEGIEGLIDYIDVIRHHHERWDGKGYPYELKGEDIPILARVTAVADAFDAMTSSRAYRHALTVEEAYQRIVEGSGSQFDPELVQLFKKVYPKWRAYHDLYNGE
jgi:hypothetical protein